jgi:ferredoxin--NADP+ reductase
MTTATNLPTPWAPTDIPSNLYKLATPFTATVLENHRLTYADSPNDVRHIVMNLEGSEYRYLDGQSVGVLPPGTDAEGKNHKLRLYSIASPSVGDDGHGKTVTLCVKRALSEGHPPGVCSSFLCDSQPGDTVNLTGPVGKAFLMPPVENGNMIMIATGTGIAPFRAFLKTRYNQRSHETGQSWLFFGCQTQKDLLYPEELATYDPNTFKLVTAISREQQNKDGGRMYVQHRLQEQAETLFNLLKDERTYIYMCGLRGMEPGVMEGLSGAAASQGIDWDSFLADLKAQHRWHVEVY